MIHRSRQHNLNDHWLVTGATGLVGEYLIKDMLLAGQKVAVVARSSKQLSAAQRIETSLQRWEHVLGCDLPRPVVLEGDVTQSDLGLTASDKDWVKQTCQHLIHNAAVLNFFGQCKNAEPWKTNLCGTKNVLRLMEDCRIEGMHYVSTAYVCGDRTGTIMEEDCDVGQSFRNDYERSKFEAEKLVRSADLNQAPSIYRPVVIAGDSTSGYTSTYHGLYLYLRMMSLLVPQQERDFSGKILTKINLPISGNEARNVVPVEWVSEVLTHLLLTPKSHGRTFHLAPQQGITANQLVQYCYEYFGSTGVEFCGTDFQDGIPDNEFAAKFMEAIDIYRDYETTDPVFDATNTKKFSGHLDCPVLSRDVIHRYLKFGEQDRWGRAKKKLPDFGIDTQGLVERFALEIMDLTSQWGKSSGASTMGGSTVDGHPHTDVPPLHSAAPPLPSAAQPLASVVPWRIGLDLVGPDGGAWTIEVPAVGESRILPGLLGNPDVVTRLTVQRLKQWMESDLVARRQIAQRWIERAHLSRVNCLS